MTIMGKGHLGWNHIVQSCQKPAFMDQHYQQCPSLETIAQAATVAPNYFHSLFKQYCGLTPYQYMLNKRMSLAQHLLFTSDLPIKTIAAKAGYPCPFHFAKIFRQYFKQSPSQRRTQNLPFARRKSSPPHHKTDISCGARTLACDIFFSPRGVAWCVSFSLV